LSVKQPTSEFSGDDEDLTPRIRAHYNVLTPLYLLLWGEHLHHGYWENDADKTPPKQAQERVLEELWEMAGRPTNVRLLDIGCGFAGPMLWLARHLKIRRALGITISPLQQVGGQARVARAGLADRVRIALADAGKTWPVDEGDFDLVWCFEMTEHLKDRAFWAREAYRALEPGGMLCLAVWVASERDDPESARLRATIARDMLCYPFSTEAEFRGWLLDAGFEAESLQVRRLASHIARSWDYGIEIGKRGWIGRLAQILGPDTLSFVGSFANLREAFGHGAMEYCFFVAKKPLG